MSFKPILPLSGLGGWAFLNRTRARQEASFNATPQIQRDVAYFREKIAGTQTADQLVSDRRLLRVTLGAFGLQDDLDNRAFLRKIIEDGTDDRRSLANRIADKRYLALATALGHLAKSSAAPPPAADLADRLTAAYQGRAFEISVGEQDPNLRLALSLQRDLPQLAESYSTEVSRWFAVLGNPPLRNILETSLGLPKEFGRINIDDQVTRMRSAMQRRFGVTDLRDMTSPEQLEALTRRFLVMAQVQDSKAVMSGSNTALMLLQNMRR